MSQIALDAGKLRKYFLAGAKNLEANRSWIDELNVFPVPDGDTGTNMTMTLLSGVKEVTASGREDMAGVCKAIAKGSLRGARGNSGVIMSQLLRGFTRCAENYDVLGTREVTESIVRAVETAYKAVMKPKEGTILTVARGISEKAQEISARNLTAEEYLGEVIRHGEEVLAKTPDMLPVLKEAGVVDAGGQGLVLFLKGVHDCMLGKTPEADESEYTEPAAAPAKSAQANMATEDIKFGYCTEFIINLAAPVPEKEVRKLGEYLDSMGDSIVLVPDDEFIKIHVHTNEPGSVLQRALTFGELTRIKIDNMREEHRELLGLGGEALSGQPEVSKPSVSEKKKEPQKSEEEKEPEKDFGFIAVAAGDGFTDLFRDLGVDIIISGGQTMNPCTDDFLEAVKKINAKTIFIFPNNSNIIMAASQAADMTKDKKIIVIPTKTVPQGLSCMVFFDPAQSPEENEAVMKETAAAVKTASVTYAIRDTSLDGYEIHEGDIMAVGDSGIIAVGQDITEVSYDGAMKMIDDDSGLISIYYGEGYDAEKAEALAEKIMGSGVYCDIDVHEGGQPVYYCIIAVE